MVQELWVWLLDNLPDHDIELFRVGQGWRVLVSNRDVGVKGNLTAWGPTRGDALRDMVQKVSDMSSSDVQGGTLQTWNW